MKLKGFTPIAKAALVAIILAAISWTGLNIPQSAVEETVDQQFDALLETVAKPDSPASTARATVTSVIDGDTARVVIDGQEQTLRFIGFDTPETSYSTAGAECYNEEATARARELLSNQTIILTTDPTQATKDVNDRLLVYATLPDGSDFGTVMLREGYAREYTYAAAYKNQSLYREAEATAKRTGAGLWSACE